MNFRIGITEFYQTKVIINIKYCHVFIHFLLYCDKLLSKYF